MNETETIDTTIQEKIQEMVRRIVERFHPERAILFGSYARGTAGADSDVDLLVVKPVQGSKPRGVKVLLILPRNLSI